METSCLVGSSFGPVFGGFMYTVSKKPGKSLGAYGVISNLGR